MLRHQVAEASNGPFPAARLGSFVILVSDILVREVRRAPRHVSATLEDLPREAVELWETGAESEALRDAYLPAGVLTE